MSSDAFEEGRGSPDPVHFEQESFFSDEAMVMDLLEVVDLQGSECSPQAVVSSMQVIGLLQRCVDTSGIARPRSHFTPSKKDVQSIKQTLNSKMEELWTMQRVEEGKDKKFEDPSYDILSGEFKKDLEKLDVPADVKGMLSDWKEIFGELPEPGSCKKIVEMDLQLKPEWQNVPLRSRCFPMPLEDQKEIEQQVQQLLEAGLVEEYTGQDFPRFCSPTFLVAKEKNKDQKTTSAKRMVGDYRK